MNMFSKIEFIAWAHRPQCKAWVYKKFDYYVLDYAESGQLMMQINDGPIQRLKGPVVFLTFPGPAFRFGRHHGYWNHRFISFKGRLADSFTQTGLFPLDKAIIGINNPKRFSSAFDSLLEYMEHQEYGAERAVHMLEGLLLQLHEQEHQKHEQCIDSRIARVIEQVSDKPEQQWDLKRLAKRSGLSYPHFRRLFITATGMPPGNFVSTKRMEKAGRFLRQLPTLSLQETASLCGYDDIYYFNKLFRRFHGIPPGKYRDNYLLK